MTSDSPDPTLPFPTPPSDGENAPLRAAYQSATRSDRSDCPDADELGQLAIGELDVTTKKRVVLHLAGCADCSGEFRALREAEEGAPQAATQGTAVAELQSPVIAGENRQTRVGSRVAWFAAAAAALLLISIPVWRAESPPTDPAAVRGGADLASNATPQGTVSAAPTSLAWPEQPGATAYVPKLYTAAAELLWTGPVTTAKSVPLPAQVIEQIQSQEASFVWTVDVRGSAARTELGPFWFHMRSPEEEAIPGSRTPDD